jgi:WD40 repeat protein
VASGRELHTLRGHSAWVNAVAFSPDGQVLASGSGLIPRVMHGPRMRPQPDANTVKLWDVDTGRELRALTGHADHVNALAFSPDGALLASASGDGTVKLWEWTSGRELRTLAGHDRAVNGLAFSPDGRTLVSASGGWASTGSRGSEAIKFWESALAASCARSQGTTGSSR